MTDTLQPQQRQALGFKELVGLVAALMAANALAIDVMLPGLPEIGHTFGITNENHRQWIITAYMAGFGVAHLVWGPLADRFGRRPVLIASLILNLLFALMVTLADSFALLIAGRALHGMAAAGARVLAVSIVRDFCSGRQMARVMSLALIIFMAAPVLAPGIGQLILAVAPWRWMFGVICIWVLVVLIWVAIRLPESLHPEYRRAITFERWAAASQRVLTERSSLGYTLAQTLLGGALFGFVNSSQQIFFDVFNAPGAFVYAFAGIAGVMAMASLLNARIVVRLGTRRVSHTALLGFIAVSAIHASVAWTGHETMWTFIGLQGATMGFFGLASANFGAMAMENVGEVAGTAASLQGFVSNIMGAGLGFAVGQTFDGTTVPIATSCVIFGLLALPIVMMTEKGRLFRPHQPAMQY